VISTLIIHESPLADDGQRWDALLRTLVSMESFLGWRGLWESGVIEHCRQARAAAAALRDDAEAWEANDDLERTNRSQLLRDLNAYRSTFDSITCALEAWPTSDVSAPSPRICELLARPSEGQQRGSDQSCTTDCECDYNCNCDNAENL
jgi:hypothetical protein